MIYTPPKVIQYLLVAGGQAVLGVPTTGQWRVYAHSKDPNGPQIITVIQTGGIIEGKDLRNGRVSEHFGIQLQFWATGNAELASAKANQVAEYMTRTVRRTTVTVNSVLLTPPVSKDYRVHSISQIGSVIPLGQEENEKRFGCSVNFTATIEELP